MTREGLLLPVGSVVGVRGLEPPAVIVGRRMRAEGSGRV